MSLVILNSRHRRSPRNLLLNDVFEDWAVGSGVFSALDASTTGSPPWESAVSEIGLDIAYHGEHSGEKFVSPLVYKFLDDNGELTPENVQKLMTAIEARYYQKWSHLWEDYTNEYNPLNTYDITESGTTSTSTSTSGTSSMTHGHVVSDSGTDTTSLTHGHVVTQSGNPTTTNTESVMGFNSSDFVDRAKSESASEVDNTETNSGIDSTSLLHGKVETNSGTDRGSSSDSGETEGEFSTTKRGTMYRSPAELLKLDRDFWLDDYFSIVFSDVDDMLTLGIYSERTPNTKVF